MDVINVAYCSVVETVPPQPLIDALHANPDTVLITLLYIEKFLKQINSKSNICICADMQLYKIMMQIMWLNPERWRHLIVRPGGMHILMSSVGSIGTPSSYFTEERNWLARPF